MVSFQLSVFLNGREWLARQMDQAGMEYRRADNCFPFIADFARAQALMDQQLTTDWTSALDACAQRIHPLFPTLFGHYPMRYYWTGFQSEWAMDIVFRDAAQLKSLYPQLVHLGMVGLSSPDVMRFMDKKVTRNGNSAGPSHAIVTDVKTRAEGVRIKHRLGNNSIKLYDKAYAECGAVLRPEVTIKSTTPGSSASSATRQAKMMDRCNGDRCAPRLPTCIAAPKSRRRLWIAIARLWLAWMTPPLCGN